jgi:hypothetical protein
MSAAADVRREVAKPPRIGEKGEKGGIEAALCVGGVC